MADEGTKDPHALHDSDRQGNKYPELTAMQMRELARQIVRLLKRDLAKEKERFGH